MPKSIIYQKVLSRIIMTSSMEKLIDSDLKQYKEIRKLTTGQGENYTTGCLLDYEYIKSCYRIITVDLSRQKKLDADLKTIQQIDFFEQLKKLDSNGNAILNADDGQSMFVLTILEKIKETQLTFSQRSLTVL